MASERKYIMCAAGGFTMHVTDSRNVEVIRVESASRLLSRDCCWAKLDPCLHYARIQAPVGNVIGQVKQTMPGCFSRYVVLDSYQHKIFTIQRESSNFSLFNFNFVIKTNDGNTVGGITRKWSGLPEDVFSNARKFSVTFPQDLEVKMKAVLLGALFLINSVHFGEDDE
ncbi:unnamed protein product [Clavelina lepadiformis]|uniref:Phospholipid scramblase n=1 Tax=Clavelina lepadiformis TaxID=159417 RepID=A0ABP0F169_CLALP